jgi:hypothetical protein
MVSSKAATVNVTGGIEGWDKARTLNNIVVTVDAVGEKAWAMIFPLLPPDTQLTYKDAKIKGPAKVNLIVKGSYPAGAKQEEALKLLNVSGNVLVPNFDAMGLDAAPKLLPITLKDGILYTADMSKGGKPIFGEPWDVNSGKLSLDSIVINLADPAMPVSIGRKQQLLKGVQLNPVLAAQLGSIASILFKDAKEASGAVDVQIVDFNKVPLADLTGGSKRAKASVVYSVKGLRVDGMVPTVLSMVLQWGNSGIVGDIENASLVLDKGVAYQDMMVQLQKTVQDRNAVGEKVDRQTREYLHFKGGVVLQTQKFQDYSMTISQGLLLREWRDRYPKGMSVKLEGEVSDFQKIMVNAVANIAVQGIGGELIEKGLKDLLKDKKK